MNMGTSVGQLIAQTMKPGGISLDQKSSAGYNFLQSLDKGSVFEGTILEIKNGQVTIGLANGDLLHARLDLELALIQGGSLFLQVKEANENQIALRPFAQVPSNNPTLIQALSYAGVEVNSKNLAMVSLMMEEQMPIDKNSVLAMTKTLLDYPQSDMRTLIQMQKYQIPISEPNVVHYEEVRDHQMEIMKNLNELTQQSGNYLDSIWNGETSHSVRQNINQIVEFLEIFAKEQSAGVKTDLPEDQTNDDLTTKTTMQPEESSLDMEVRDKKNINIINDTSIKDRSIIDAPIKENPSPQKEIGTSETVLTQNKENYEEQQINNSLSRLFNHWKASAQSENQNIFEVLDQVREALRGLSFEQKNSSGNLSEIYSNQTKKLFREFVHQVMEKSFTIEPESLKQLPEFFDKLMNQMNRLNGVTAEMGKTGETLSQNAGEMKSQIQFLADLNQVYHYMQLPLKLKQQSTTGELYVYTHKNKGNMQKKDLSAHLHLEMEHLGTTDVYVKLEEKKVQTHFYLANDRSFDLIMQNLDVLTKRLNKRGYQVDIQVENIEKKLNFIEDFVDEKSKAGKVQRYTIDVRV